MYGPTLRGGLDFSFSDDNSVFRIAAASDGARRSIGHCRLERCQAPAGLHFDWDKVRAIYTVHAVEVAVLPLADCVDLVHNLAGERDLPVDGREPVLPDIIGDSFAIHCPDGFDRLRQRLQRFVISQTAPVVGIYAGDFLMPLVESVDFRGVPGAPGAQDVLCRSAEFLTEALEIRAHGAVIRFDIKPFDLGLLGEAKGIGWIGPGDKDIRIGRCGSLDDRRIVLCS